MKTTFIFSWPNSTRGLLSCPLPWMTWLTPLRKCPSSTCNFFFRWRISSPPLRLLCGRPRLRQERTSLVILLQRSTGKLNQICSYAGSSLNCSQSIKLSQVRHVDISVSTKIISTKGKKLANKVNWFVDWVDSRNEEFEYAIESLRISRKNVPRFKSKASL